MKTRYILGSLDQPLYLIVHNAHTDAKKTMTYDTTNDCALATRFDYMSLAAMRLAQLESIYPVISALNLVALPINNGAVEVQFNLPL